jgi:thiol-disulfide isomerase/thioredoxin
MRKLFFIMITMFLLFPEVSVKAQESDIVVKDSISGKDILYGATSREGLINIGTWFNEEYSLYTPDPTAIDLLKKNSDKLPHLFIVLGTWCGDSREHVPHFFKVADLIGYPQEKIFMVSVDRKKTGGDFCLADFDITLVPTFIFTHKGEEIGRIIETPTISLEQDLVNILNLK